MAAALEAQKPIGASTQNEMSCSICLDVTDEGIKLRCGYGFCARCLKRCAEHNHSRCPHCREPHLLDPDALRAAVDKYRSDYRSWRTGKAGGAKGSVASLTAPPLDEAKDDGETVEVPLKLVPDQSKETEAFRNYDLPNERGDTVTRHYRDMRTFQTVAFVDKMHAKYSFENGRCRARMSVLQCFEKLEGYVDSSDPDLDLPNLIHMLQTAEGIRKAGHPDWFQLVGLIHDMGKIMYLWGAAEDGQVGTAEGPQWALGGDTWAVGCALPTGEARPGVVFPEFSALNPDMADPRYNTKNGMYEEGCGIDALRFAYGHDEYLYQMLLANGVALPKEALAMVRYHSAYPWHTGRIYDHFMKPEDTETLKWVLEFNKFDLYTKDEDNAINFAELWPYYQQIVDKYMPGELKW